MLAKMRYLVYLLNRDFNFVFTRSDKCHKSLTNTSLLLASIKDIQVALYYMDVNRVHKCIGLEPKMFQEQKY